MKKLISVFFLVVLSVLVFVGYYVKDGYKDIVDIVVSNDMFFIFVIVVKFVDLVIILKGDGLFIVFVFIDEVFVVLLVDIVEMLLKFENK